MTNKLVSIGLISVVLLTLIYTVPLWTRNPGGLWIPVIFLVILAGFIWLIVKLIGEIILLIRNGKIFKWNQALPTILIAGVLYFVFFNTFSFDIDEKVYGKVIFRACYEGTQNQATFKLREGNKFEIHATGVFFSDEYFTGQYAQHGDTLDLKYDEQVHGAVGERVIMNNQDSVVHVIKQNVDSTRRPLIFYYGYCKGLN